MCSFFPKIQDFNKVFLKTSFCPVKSRVYAQIKNVKIYTFTLLFYDLFTHINLLILFYIYKKKLINLAAFVSISTHTRNTVKDNFVSRLYYSHKFVPFFPSVEAGSSKNFFYNNCSRIYSQDISYLTLNILFIA